MFELLEHHKIIAVIEPQNLTYLAKLDIFDSIDSTNTYLLLQEKQGAPSGSICFAEHQQQGRGRRGREWFSQANTNIYFSILWRFTTSEALSGLSIACAVMVANTLKKYGICSGIELKWPNDVLFSQRKLAGILLERTGEAVVIGIGLNLSLPVAADANWIALQEITGQPIARNYLAGLLANEMLNQVAMYETRGLKPFLSDWHRQDVLLNKAVTIQTPKQNVSGTMQGINHQGELILLDADGQTSTFAYGDVSCRRID